MRTHYKPLSRFFPANHPRAGEPTHFIEKICLSLLELDLISTSRTVEIARAIGSDLITDLYSLRSLNVPSKVHTIRATGKKPIESGDSIQFFSWRGAPYRSPWLVLLPPIPIVKTWPFQMEPRLWLDECQFKMNSESAQHLVGQIARNDGLKTIDFAEWFCGSAMADSKRKPFTGSILCWDERINYSI